MKNWLKKIVLKNAYLVHYLYKIYSIKSEKEVNDCLKYLRSDDPLQDLAVIKEFAKAAQNGKITYTSSDKTGPASRVYGYCANVFGRKVVNSVYAPIIEHGLILYDYADYHIRENARPVAVTLGEFRKNIIESSTNIPTFTVGPFIQYANNIYDDKRMKEIKQNLGRNLLVFPAHGTDGDILSRQNVNFINRVKTEMKNFDTVTVSAFWWNVNDSLYSELEKIGCKIVSCGFREDINFLNRLRTCIELCDMALGDGVSTSMGFCVNLNKPFCYFDSGVNCKSIVTEEIEHDNYYKLHETIIKNAFLEKREIDEKVEEICRYYWGQGIKRTEEEIEAIYKFNKKIMKKSRGFVHCYNKNIYKELNAEDNSTIRFLLQK